MLSQVYIHTHTHIHTHSHRHIDKSEYLTLHQMRDSTFFTSYYTANMFSYCYIFLETPLIAATYHILRQMYHNLLSYCPNTEHSFFPVVIYVYFVI